MMQEIVVHERFKDLILMGVKTAVMLQKDFVENGPLKFICREGNKELPFCTAIARHCAFLKLIPNTETIKVFAIGEKQDYWHTCDSDMVKKIILNEGFLHKDDFWQAMQVRGIFQVNQFYFDTVQPYHESILTIV